MIKFDVGLELGTTNIKIYLKNENCALTIPSVIAVRKNSGRVLGFGDDAYKMLGKAPESIVVKKTIENGVVSDLNLNRILIEEVLFKKFGRYFKKPRVCLCFHGFMTELEKLVLKNSISFSNTSKIYLIDEALASWIGVGVDFSDDSCYLVVNIGGGTTDISIVSSNGILNSKSIQIGGEAVDEVIRRNLRDKYNLLIGRLTAEKIKKRSTTLLNTDENLKFKIKGKDRITNMPQILEISQKQICEGIEIPIKTIVASIYELIQTVPAETIVDVQKNGIILTGGGSLLLGLKKYLEKRLHINVITVEDPINCSAFGAFISTAYFNDNLSQFILPA